MKEIERIECSNCAERNTINDIRCKHCKEKLDAGNTIKCPKCGILISKDKDYCKLCSILNAKGGATGCVYGISILLFIVGIVFLFFIFKIALSLILISIILYIIIFIIIKTKSNKIINAYSIKRKVPL